MATVQSIIGEARQQRADNNVDPKQTIAGTLTATGEGFRIAQTHLEAISRLARVHLELSNESVPTPFVLKLKLKVDRERLLKEVEQLEKVIANSDRQLSNADIIAKMPEKVVTTLRQKKAEYEAHLAKSRAALDESE